MYIYVIVERLYDDVAIVGAYRTREAAELHCPPHCYVDRVLLED